MIKWPSFAYFSCVVQDLFFAYANLKVFFFARVGNAIKIDFSVVPNHDHKAYRMNEMKMFYYSDIISCDLNDFIIKLFCSHDENESEVSVNTLNSAVN